MKKNINEWDLFLRSDVILNYLIDRDNKKNR